MRLLNKPRAALTSEWVFRSIYVRAAARGWKFEVLARRDLATGSTESGALGAPPSWWRVRGHSKPLTGSVMADRGGATRLSGRCRSLLDSKRRQRRPQAYWERFSADC